MLSLCQHHSLFEPARGHSSSLLSLLADSPWSEDVISNYGYYFRSVLEHNAPYLDGKAPPPLNSTKSRNADSLQARACNSSDGHTAVAMGLHRCLIWFRWASRFWSVAQCLPNVVDLYIQLLFVAPLLPNVVQLLIQLLIVLHPS